LGCWYHRIFKELSRNNCCVKALRFGWDLADLIEQNHRNSSAISRILRLRIGQRWPKDEMHECNSYSVTAPKFIFSKLFWGMLHPPGRWQYWSTLPSHFVLHWWIVSTFLCIDSDDNLLKARIAFDLCEASCHSVIIKRDQVKFESGQKMTTPTCPWTRLTDKSEDYRYKARILDLIVISDLQSPIFIHFSWYNDRSVYYNCRHRMNRPYRPALGINAELD